MSNVDKQHAAVLLERLDSEQATVAVRFMEFLLLDPVARGAATALPDDEPVTDEDRRRIENGRRQPSGARSATTMAGVLAEFQLKPEDFPARG
ncbi:MAG: hypothetical protein JJE39_10565 [Vicinamibacteria bacterium]|nr:hypothetical protein [Vicinamibacteria bacterium]